MKTDLELQILLAKMLPEKIHVVDVAGNAPLFYLLQLDKIINKRLDEFHWLHVCWLIERGMPYDNSVKGRVAYDNKLMTICGSHQACVSASWQQRASALIAVNGEK